MRVNKDLARLYAQWFDRPGLPQLYASWSEAGDGRLDRFPVQVRAADRDGKVQSRTAFCDFSGVTSTVHFAAMNGVYRVNPDFDHAFLWLPSLWPSGMTRQDGRRARLQYAWFLGFALPECDCSNFDAAPSRCVRGASRIVKCGVSAQARRAVGGLIVDLNKGGFRG